MDILIYTIQACEIPTSQNEHSHYTCDDDGEVKCLPGWTGDLCDVPKCRSGCDPLQGYCNRPGECLCKLGYYGERCNKCIPLPGCQHGYCNVSFECICQEGWDGLFCSEPICSKTCHKERGYCRKPGECRCKVGWWGKNCEKCYPYPGCANGNCTRPWECNCKPGWGGMLCDEELNYCEKNPDTCKNGSKCLSLTKEDGKFRCLCREGTSGKNCELSTLTTTTTTTTVEPENEEEIEGGVTTEDLTVLEEQSISNQENNITQ
ncbi:notch ligand family member [Holotrichia oblita]|uniref:Notch ligand family member n=1 Tax=Holotrichia oblita TaxID=644536 RepID=A0ACB9SWG7_HOLOL|nr:notch ligand family member [Holotrichia oblita]